MTYHTCHWSNYWSGKMYNCDQVTRLRCFPISQYKQRRGQVELFFLKKNQISAAKNRLIKYSQYLWETDTRQTSQRPREVMSLLEKCNTKRARRRSHKALKPPTVIYPLIRMNAFQQRKKKHTKKPKPWNWLETVANMMMMIDESKMDHMTSNMRCPSHRPIGFDKPLDNCMACTDDRRSFVT